MTEAFDSIKQGLLEAIAHASGQRSTATVHVPRPIDVKAIRKQVGMTQREFAATFGMSVSTLQHWERGDRMPQGPARMLLRLIAMAPHTVLKALAATGDNEDVPASDTSSTSDLSETPQRDSFTVVVPA